MLCYNQAMSKLPADFDATQPLKNRRWEQFCQEFLTDLNDATRAYKAAGFACKSAGAAKSAASRLLKDAKIKARLDHLQRTGVDRVNATTLAPHNDLQITHDNTLANLAALAYVNIADYLTFDEHGQPSFNLDKVPREKLAGIARIKIKELAAVELVVGGEVIPREVREIEIALWDKNRALENMMKHQGLLEQQTTVINIEAIDKMILFMRNDLVARGIDPDQALQELQRKKERQKQLTGPSQGIAAQPK